MSAAEVIKKFTDRAVIVDDAFAPARLEMIQEEHWGQLRHAEIPEEWTQIRDSHFVGLERPIDLKRHPELVATAWDLFNANPTDYRVFDPLFAHIVTQRRGTRWALRSLLEFLGEVGIEVIQHADIKSAEADIKASKLVFLDFYLRPEQPEEIIAEIASYENLFSSPVMSGGNPSGRFVFLISSDLPPRNVIEQFRRKTNLKSAFFKSLPKAEITKVGLENELLLRIERYDSLWALYSYLEMFSAEIALVSQALRTEISGLELHDLGILDRMRLATDSENLGDYLTWLLSESLAAKIRSSTPLLKAAEGFSRIERVPFQGSLEPNLILFDLYSTVVFTRMSGQKPKKVHFGDVFSRTIKVKKKAQPASEAAPAETEAAPEAQAIAKPDLESQVIESQAGSGAEELVKSAEGQAPAVTDASGPVEDPEKVVVDETHEDAEELLLVIAPGCDLQRCEAEYQVLCVRGSITTKVATLRDLLRHKSVFGKTQNSFKHLFTNSEGSDFSVVEWEPQSIVTLPHQYLVGADVKYLAKINEIFAQEVKEEALRQAGRVGVPVDPSFSTALDATLNLKLTGRGNFHVENIQSTEFISGILVSGNEQNTIKLTLSAEFLERLDRLKEELSAVGKTLDESSEKSIAKLIEEGGRGLEFGKKNALALDGGFRVRFVEKFTLGTADKDNGIVLYPCGAQEEADPVEPTPQG